KLFLRRVAFVGGLQGGATFLDLAAQLDELLKARRRLLTAGRPHGRHHATPRLPHRGADRGLGRALRRPSRASSLRRLLLLLLLLGRPAGLLLLRLLLAWPLLTLLLLRLLRGPRRLGGGRARPQDHHDRQRTAPSHRASLRCALIRRAIRRHPYA